MLSKHPALLLCLLEQLSKHIKIQIVNGLAIVTYVLENYFLVLKHFKCTLEGMQLKRLSGRYIVFAYVILFINPIYSNRLQINLQVP